MTTKKFSSLYVHNLSVNDLYALTRSSIEYAEPVKESLSELINAALSLMEAANTAMSEQMNKALTNALTAEISDLDEERDERFSEIKRNVSTCIKARDETKKTAAANLKVFLNAYWDTDKEPMNTETGVFMEMMGKYNASDSLKADAATTGIATMMTELEACNNEFNTLYQTRNTEEATQSGPSASSLKGEVVDGYSRFCAAVEQAVNLTSTDVLNNLFYELDELRKKYSALASRNDEEEPQAETSAT